jgi:hypothetical protein
VKHGLLLGGRTLITNVLKQNAQEIYLGPLSQVVITTNQHEAGNKA